MKPAVFTLGAFVLVVHASSLQQLEKSNYVYGKLLSSGSFDAAGFLEKGKSQVDIPQLPPQVALPPQFNAPPTADSVINALPNGQLPYWNPNLPLPAINPSYLSSGLQNNFPSGIQPISLPSYIQPINLPSGVPPIDPTLQLTPLIAVSTATISTP